MDIMTAIKITLRIKRVCTLSDIVKATGLKYPQVLQEVSDNRRLLKLNRHGGIMGFDETNTLAPICYLWKHMAR